MDALNRKQRSYSGIGDDARRIDAMLGWDNMKRKIVGRMIGGGDDATMLGWDNMEKRIVGGRSIENERKGEDDWGGS